MPDASVQVRVSPRGAGNAFVEAWRALYRVCDDAVAEIINLYSRPGE